MIHASFKNQKFVHWGSASFGAAFSVGLASLFFIWIKFLSAVYCFPCGIAHGYLPTDIARGCLPMDRYATYLSCGIFVRHISKIE